jgi:hypothetical protein
MGCVNFVWVDVNDEGFEALGYGVLREIWDTFWLKVRNLGVGLVNLRLGLMFMKILGEVGGC